MERPVAACGECDRLIRVDEHTTLESQLRSTVIGVRRQWGKRRMPLVLTAGVLGGLSCTVEVDPEGWDHALRVEVTSALIDSAGPACALVWLTRAGLPQWHGHDAAWVSPVLSAWSERGERGRFVVVTPRGWYDPVTGRGRQWRRPRQHC